MSVEFVLDFGGSQPVVGCVKVPSGDNGYQALAAFTQQENLAPPTYAQSGLLCTINDVPDPNGPCGQPVPGAYIYWSYWHGSSGDWQYSSTGASGAVTQGDVEGWKFQNPGHGNPTDPPPTVAPAYASVCGPEASVTTTTTTTTTATTPATAPATTVVPASPGGFAATRATQPTSKTPATAAASSGPTTTVAAAGSTSTSSPPTTSTGQSDHQAHSLSAAPADVQKEGGGSPAPFIIGGLILAALVAASVFRWRKRPEAR